MSKLTDQEIRDRAIQLGKEILLLLDGVPWEVGSAAIAGAIGNWFEDDSFEDVDVIAACSVLGEQIHETRRVREERLVANAVESVKSTKH